MCLCLRTLCVCVFSLSSQKISRPENTYSIPTPSNDAALSVTSAEDAMKMLALQHKKQQQQQKKPAMSTKDNERAAYDFSKEQLARVRANLRKFGEPNPAQCGKFLRKLTSGLVQRLRFPRPAIRGPVSQAFKNCSWDIRKNRSVPGSRPPKGSDLELLVFRLVSIFAKIFGDPAPTAAPKRAPMRGGSRRGPPRNRNRRNGARKNMNDEKSDEKKGNNTRRNGNRRRRNAKPREEGASSTTRRRNNNARRAYTRPRGGVRGSGGRDNGNKN